MRLAVLGLVGLALPANVHNGTDEVARNTIAGHEFVFSESSEVFGLPAFVRKISGVVEKLSNLPKVLSFEKNNFQLSFGIFEKTLKNFRIFRITSGIP